VPLPPVVGRAVRLAIWLRGLALPVLVVFGAADAFGTEWATHRVGKPGPELNRRRDPTAAEHYV